MFVFLKYSDVEIGKNTFHILFKDTKMIIDQSNFILHLDCEGTVPLFYVYVYIRAPNTLTTMKL